MDSAYYQPANTHAQDCWIKGENVNYVSHRMCIHLACTHVNLLMMNSAARINTSAPRTTLLEQIVLATLERSRHRYSRIRGASQKEENAIK